MRRFLLTFISFILSVTMTYGQILENTIGNGVSKTNGKILYQGSLFNGYLFGNYETGQIKYKYQVVDGTPNGYYYQYYRDQNYNPNRYKDSVKISSIQKARESDLKVLEQLIADSLSSSRKLSEYFTREIKTDKKLAALKEKKRNGKLKGKNLEIYHAYSLLLRNHQTIKRDIKNYTEIINNFETALKNENSKNVYIPIVELNYNQLNLIKNGTFKSYHPNGKLKELGDYQNNFKVGKWLAYYDSGKIEKEFTANRSGINEGLYKEYYINGNLKAEGAYKSGLQNGQWTYFYENGKIKGKGDFVNGNGTDPGSTGIPRNNRNGEWYFYENNGNIKEIALWKNGVLESDKYFSSDGNILFLRVYSDTKQKNWEEIVYFESSGRIQKVLTFVNGKQQGQQKTFYEDGNIEWSGIVDTNSTVSETQFIDIKKYDENGALIIHEGVSNGHWVDKLANSTNTASNTTISKNEINKKYMCKCCKATINGLTDGVDESGGEYSDYHFHYYNKIYGTPEMANLFKDQAELYNSIPMLSRGEKMSSEFNVYEMLRGNFKYCSFKCAKVCAED